MITILTGRSIVDDPHIRSGKLLAIPLTGFSVPNSMGIYMFSRKRSSLNYFEKAAYDSLQGYCERTLNSLESDENLYPAIESLNQYWKDI